MYEQSLNLTNEQMRSVVMEAMKGCGSTQWVNLRDHLPEVAQQMGLMPTPKADQNSGFGGRIVYSSGGRDRISNRDYAQMQNVVWDLIIEGILRPGVGDGQNEGLPFFHVTEWGKEVLTGSPPVPYDPDGYLKRLQGDVPNLDAVILTYLTESLRTFRIGALLSSTITLGCASEKALLLLIESYAASLPQASREKFEANTKGRMIKRQFDELRKAIEGDLRGRLPRDLEDGLDIELTALFDFIRNQRNDAGHPTGKTIERERAYANLVVLPTYLRKVYDLIDWVKANPKK